MKRAGVIIRFLSLVIVWPHPGYGAVETPAGLILAATGDVFIDTHRTETQFIAGPGIALFDGYTLRNGTGSVRFSFCQKSAEYTLAPHSSVTLRGETLEGTGFMQVGPTAFCKFPSLKPAGSETRGDSGAFEPTLTADRKEELDRRLAPINSALAKNPLDLAAHAARVAVFQEFGLTARMHEAARSLTAAAPEATWTRDIVHPSISKPPATNPGKIYAILVGVSEYKYNPPGSLHFADKDAGLFAELLESSRRGAQETPEIRVLTNRNATRAAIDREVERMAKENAASSASNTLVLFVAGHGAYVKTEQDTAAHKGASAPYILTYDSNPQDPKTTGYPMSEFQKLIATQASRFGRVLVFVDICHAKEIGPLPSSGAALAPAVRRVFAGEEGEFGMLLATKDLAFESELFGKGHGAFTYYVVDGWNGGAATLGGKEIQFEDLAEYVAAGVRRLTNKKQTPEAVVPDPALLVTPDAKTGNGIRLDPALPLPPDAATRGRKPAPGKATIAAGAQEVAQSQPGAPESFEAALAAGVLRSDELGGAGRFLEQARGTVSPDQWEDMRRRLLIALEDRGQETILRYLEGDQIPQTKSDFEACSAFFDDAARLDPDSSFDEARMLFCKGRALIFDHAYGSAQTLLERAIRIDPSRGYAYNALGIAYLEQIAANASTFDAAVSAFHDAIRFAPYWAYPLHNLALTYTQKGDYAAAIDAYRAAMDAGKQYSYLPYNLGLLYQQLHELSLAEIYYRLANSRAELNPHVIQSSRGSRWTERSEIWDALGTLETERRRWSRAEKDFRQAIADDPQSLNARHNLALLLSRTGESSEAERLWKDNLDSDARHLPSLLGYGDYMVHNGAFQQAMALYERIEALRPQYPGIHRKIATLWMQLGQPERALGELRLAAQYTAANPELLEAIGDLESQLGDVAGALSDWNRAAQLKTNSQGKQRLFRKIAGK
jgi:tetratricopeptide (TPR) repeat protein